MIKLTNRDGVLFAVTVSCMLGILHADITPALTVFSVGLGSWVIMCVVRGLFRFYDRAAEKYSRAGCLAERVEQEELTARARQEEFDAECLAFEQDREAEPTFDELVFEPPQQAQIFGKALIEAMTEADYIEAEAMAELED